MNPILAVCPLFCPARPQRQEDINGKTGRSSHKWKIIDYGSKQEKENFADLVHNEEQEYQHNLSPSSQFTQINVLQKIGFGAGGYANIRKVEKYENKLCKGSSL